MPFEPVEQRPKFPQMEQRVAQRWREREVFARSLRQREGGPLFSFYEGPPTANGRPGVHHVEARTFKDIFPRYRTMKGYRVPRKAGWDCHGLPVELEIEKELGFNRKREIEDYGIAAFNARCRESVTRYVDEWARLTERIGFWVDLDDAYWTMSTPYVESVWWSLKQLWERGLIYQGHRVTPYCPRCGTGLSDAEVAMGYDTAVDPSVYVRFPVIEGRLGDEGAALLIWTTTPWTLISNTAVAVGPDIRYVLVDDPMHGRLVLAADLVDAVLGEDAQVVRDVTLDELRGLHYAGPFDFVTPDAGPDWRYVTVGDFITTTDGTGIVHMAPAFGEDDMRMARTYGLPVVNPVDGEGRFDDRVVDFAGLFVKDADDRITADLQRRGLLVRSGTYEHTYPFCWRCRTPLLYYAMPSWYIATTRIRDRLLEVNEGVDWHPEHIRRGRYGDWLANNVDWSLSRSRYWGTPLPLWRCPACDGITAVGSLAELSALAGRDLADLDPHRPAVDEIGFPCPSCGEGPAQRVPEVIDAWYDSGSMPFAQFGYPHAEGSAELFKERLPADYICEAIDQTRGWFYSLMANATLLFDANSYRTVLVLGHIVDADGRKMSKSVGNILDPWKLLDTRGADALRWLLLTDGSPWAPRRLSGERLDEVIRQFLLTLWNTYYFFVTYARTDGWEPGESSAPPATRRPVMDRWVLAELAEVVRTVDAGLERFDATTAGRALAGFVDDLSNWYVRRSRSRFWRSENDADKDMAFATLHECLTTLVALLAPFTPFVADELHGNLDGGSADSVHLLDFPAADETAADPGLLGAMSAARRVVELGRRARNDARIGIRQPLRSALVTLPTDVRATWPQVAEVVADELNVHDLTVSDGTDAMVSHRLKPNFRALGPLFGARTPVVARVIADADPAQARAVAERLRADGDAHLEVDGDPVRVTSEQVTVVEESETGWQVAADGPFSVALDLDVDEGLRREGLARELVRALNDLRKRRGLELTDRVRIEVAADGEVAAAIDAFGDEVAREVLAVELVRGAAEDGEALEIGQDVAVKVRLEVAAQA